jgi:hypothetical protein
MGLADHPLVVWLQVSGAVAGMATGLFGLDAGSPAAIYLGAGLAIFCFSAWLCPYAIVLADRTIDWLADLADNSEPQAPATVQPAQCPAPQPNQTGPAVVSLARQESAERWERVHPASMANHAMPDLWRTVFGELRLGYYATPPHSKAIAAIVDDWVQFQYRWYVEWSKPSAGEDLKNRYYDRAWERLKAGKLAVGHAVPEVVRHLERWAEQQMFAAT